MPSRFATYIRFHSSAGALARAAELIKVPTFLLLYASAQITDTRANGIAKPSLVLAEGRLVTHAFTESIVQFRHFLVEDGIDPVMRGITYWRFSSGASEVMITSIPVGTFRSL